MREGLALGEATAVDSDEEDGAGAGALEDAATLVLLLLLVLGEEMGIGVELTEEMETRVALVSGMRTCEV